MLAQTKGGKTPLVCAKTPNASPAYLENEEENHAVSDTAWINKVHTRYSGQSGNIWATGTNHTGQGKRTWN